MENKARALFFSEIYGTVPVHWDAKQGYGNTGIRQGVRYPSISEVRHIREVSEQAQALHRLTGAILVKVS